MSKVLIVLLIILSVFSCSRQEAKHDPGGRPLDKRKPMSWGQQQNIYIFADDNVWKYGETYLRNSLERYYFTTENETYFEIRRISIDQLEQFYRFNNLIFYCDLASEAPVSSYVKRIMGEQVAADVSVDAARLYPQHNLWANDQYVLFILGDTEENLLKLNILQANRIFELFRQKLYDRISNKIFSSPVYPAGEFRNWPWTLQLPRNYQLYRNLENENFVSYLARAKEKPDRYISVYYEPMLSDSIDREWLKETRADLAWKFYDEDYFLDKDIKFEKINLGEREAWKLSGRWQNRKHVMGGTFQSFAFYDKINRIAYLIDNSVYFPEGFKLAALIELEIISQTLAIK